ncbi:dTDP-4-amino-4,6-dideoxygalactose transaminase [Maricaulis sp. W15]|uniref:dTDP-4-amino-4,6-dideoxygalactose transaminase n=1 Tax=Maricaulis maris TaxID=74318 RepID=A0A495DLD1_9PROT|nr:MULTISPECIES: dTDP-4-amino-4,6-dideoxygalactose transaminase [Maricaulis]OLF81344.1 dTDP-4-amino-4,6-dideoxygalactose transaminase [Maricaulis sp. W15]RKR03743.1 dTDP-4-amino-4,6-dideoxygalactose transaminase [Maricaulis maris]
MTKVSFNVPNTVGRETDYLLEAVAQGHLSGDGPFTKKCHAWLDSQIGGHGLLTHSCTGALEMACLLADLQPGDEVILPSYTFVSTANAVALRGAIPVFVDIRDDTLNIDERLIEAAITERTKAVIVVHYAGVVAEMDAINAIASKHGLFVIEDAAQALFSTYRGRQAGTLSDAAAFSFHETKNILSGEGGALIVRDEALFHRAEIIREKGTNRSQFFRGAIDKYTWVDLGSSYLPSELVAAFLYAQLERAAEIIQYRRDVCSAYQEAFTALEAKGRLRLPVTPDHCESNGHMFYLILNNIEDRSAFIEAMKAAGIMTPFHYVPLHSAPAGRRLGRVEGSMANTDSLSERLVRLPVYYGVKDEVSRVVEVALTALG